MIRIKGLHPLQQLILVGWLLFLMAVLGACGTLEVGIEAEPVAAGDDLTTSTPRPTPIEPAYDTAVQATFGDQIELVGYSLSQADPGGAMMATLVWKALAEVQRDFIVFIHAVDSEGLLVAQVDGDPVGGAWPTSSWSPGQFVSDQHSLSLPEGIGLDDLTLLVGLYDSETGDRLESDPPTFTELPDSSEGGLSVLVVETIVPTEQDITAGELAEDDEQTPAIPPTYPLHVAYVKNENAWLWTEEGGSMPLTTQGGIDDVLVSDDGQRVAFRRGQNLWVVNSDGTAERNLTTQRDFAGIEIGAEMAPYVKSIYPSQLAWRPGTHILYFNTAPEMEGPGLFLNDDLWEVDVDSGQLSPVLAPGEGGNFYFSPDGSLLAIVTPGRIDLIDPDGGNRWEGLTHTPVITYSEFQYYARPIWAADSSALMVAIPPVDVLGGDHQATTSWFIDAENKRARLVGNLTAAPGGSPVFNPDLSRVAYLFGDGPASGPDSPPPGLAIAEIAEGGLGESNVYSQAVDNLGEWSPDAVHFIYTPAGPLAPLRHIGAVGDDPLVLGDGQSAIAQSNWVGPNHVLFLQNNGLAWDILLGGIDNRSPRLLDSVEGSPPATHFSGTPG